jgi:DNA repair exonuclease SbcCD ATPase subunit
MISPPSSNLNSAAMSDLQPASSPQPTSLSSPDELRKRADKLCWHRDELAQKAKRVAVRLKELDQYLEIAEDVSDALEHLSQELFEEVLGVLEKQLSIAIEEVLDQPIRFKSEAAFKSGAAHVSFSVERDGHGEDVQRGQGGSVQNILSVGLRMFALASLDAEEHRRFLVLDEQDCWLRPELVPRLVNIVHKAARELKFQVIMISHHDIGLFEKYADKVYRLSPGTDGVSISDVNPNPVMADAYVSDGDHDN